MPQPKPPRQEISIHALREEGDRMMMLRDHDKNRISIHALREEGDGVWIFDGLKCTLFLSTPSARRATCTACLKVVRKKFLSTPSARRATEVFAVHLHEIRFLSTPSARRATPLPKFYHEKRLISIHALREEGDSCLFLPLHQNFNFYPRPPRGGRRYQVQLFRSHGLFLSTPSARRATFGLAAKESREPISIHALREEGDLDSRRMDRGGFYFYPRPPRGGRPARKSGDDHQYEISIHALREEGDRGRSGC